MLYMLSCHWSLNRSNKLLAFLLAVYIQHSISFLYMHYQVCTDGEYKIYILSSTLVKNLL